MFSKVLVANRGEIACRLIRALRDMNIESVAVYSDADRGAAHVRLADCAVPLGPAEAQVSYLHAGKLIDAARRTGARAILPGYGFLSENSQFAEACEQAGITFVGPRASTIRAMGSKTQARALAQVAGVPVVPGGSARSLAEAQTAAAEIGYPVLLKAAMGGGGKGMRLVTDPKDLAKSLARARSEAKSAFASEEVYLEKAITGPRHVEIQVLGDKHGNLIHLYERDCSIQRRHQKVFEETPSPRLSDSARNEMARVALQVARQVGYDSVGTVEFLVDANEQFYFLEMNTRLQVEHTVTELVNNVDLVEQMLRVAAGHELALQQEDIQPRGFALQCRIYAEDPAHQDLPCAGTVSHVQLPAGPFVRFDHALVEHTKVSSYYDPLLGKLCTWGQERTQVLSRMRRALSELHVGGLTTNAPLLLALLNSPELIAGDYDTSTLEAVRAAWLDSGHPPPLEAVAAAVAARHLDRSRESAPNRSASPLSEWARARRPRWRD